MIQQLIVWIVVLFLGSLPVVPTRLCAQTTDAGEPLGVIIADIKVEGNRRTRSRIILRELPFALGDTLTVEELSVDLHIAQQHLMNTHLFRQADVRVTDWSGSDPYVAQITVQVNESWYIYPFPIFELADRNFNVWWKEQKRSFERVNYGLSLRYKNFTGNYDDLTLRFETGFSREYALRYQRPYINAAQTLGFESWLRFRELRTINYATLGNRQAFFKADDERPLMRNFFSQVALTYRPEIRSRHLLAMDYNYYLTDTLVRQTLNPVYLLEGKTVNRYFSLVYRYDYEYRDLRKYAWQGHYLRFEFRKDGLGLRKDRNALSLTSRLEHYQPVGTRWSLASRLRIKYSFLRQQQPYYDNRAFGYDDTHLPGYEFYVIDGMDMFTFKGSMRYELWCSTLNLGKFMPVKSLRQPPIRVILLAQAGTGYVNDPYTAADNPASNQMLYGAGVGIAVVLWHGKVIRLDHSYNHQGEGGFFIHLGL